MIKINLLPIKKVTKKAALIEQGVFAAFVAAVVLLLLSGIYVYIKGQVKDREQKIVSTKVALEKLKKDEAQIEELKKSLAVLEQKTGVIKQLEDRKTGPVKMLAEIVSSLPGKMWLTSLKSQGSVMTLQGVSIDNETIAQFMTNLENSSEFEKVELQFAEETKIQDFMLKKFSLTSSIMAMKEAEASKPAEASKGKTK